MKARRVTYDTIEITDARPSEVDQLIILAYLAGYPVRKAERGSLVIGLPNTGPVAKRLSRSRKLGEVWEIAEIPEECRA